MYYKSVIISIILAILAYKYLNISHRDLIIPKLTPIFPYLGIFSCLFLSALGTLKGMKTIGLAVSGGSIIIPRIGSKSIIGTVFCEANFVLGTLMCYIMISDLEDLGKFTTADVVKHDAMCYLMFATGFIVGICNYCSSVSTGVICGAICLMDAKDPTLFSKLVAMELISSSIGPLGTVFGFILKTKYNSLKSITT